jgi:hypothetical protein
MKELWTARVRLLTPPTEFGDTKCCANIVAWAESPEDFIATASAILARRNWSIFNVQQCKRAADCTAIVQELADQIEQAKMVPGRCIFGTLQYYPSKPA